MLSQVSVCFGVDLLIHLGLYIIQFLKNDQVERNTLKNKPCSESLIQTVLMCSFHS